MKETKAQKEYYDMVEKVEGFNKEAAELLYYDVIFQNDFKFDGWLPWCFGWGSHDKGHDYWRGIKSQLEKN